MDNNQARYIEGYAAALQDILRELTGESMCCKSYDPMTIDEAHGVMHSYAFDMKDGGRHHEISEYTGIDEIKHVLLQETVGHFRASA